MARAREDTSSSRAGCQEEAEALLWVQGVAECSSKELQLLLQMQGTADQLTSNLASGEGKLPQIHLHSFWSENADTDSQAQKKDRDSVF